MMHATKFDTVCMGNILGLEELNDNCAKIMHTPVTDAGFTRSLEPTNFRRRWPLVN
jgi:hypothetical protein